MSEPDGKMRIACSVFVLGLLYLFSQLVLESTACLPRCQDQEVIFESEPRNVSALCRAHENVTFPCQYTGSEVLPRWVINGTDIYSSHNYYLPPDHSYKENALTVTNLKQRSESSYQCRVTSFYGCSYQSQVAFLFCKDIKVQSYPHYLYEPEKPEMYNLIVINTTIIQIDSSERIYNISYTDSKSGEMCNYNIVTCQSELCSDMFDATLSNCQNTPKSITITVSAVNGEINPQPDPIIIDTANNFVRVSIDGNRFRCEFLNQCENSRKSCSIKYGPKTPGCKNLTLHLSNATSDSNDIKIQLEDHHFIGSNTGFCFEVIAYNDTKSVMIKGTTLKSASSTAYIYHSLSCHSFIMCLIIWFMYTEVTL